MDKIKTTRKQMFCGIEIDLELIPCSVLVATHEEDDDET